MLKICLLVGAAAWIAAGPALAADDCAGSLQKFAAQREAAMQGINQMVAAAKGKKLDAEAFCARSRPLNSAEEAMLAYMVKNKDWCQIPDDAIAQLKATHLRSASFGGKACTVAAQMKKMKEQAAQAQQSGAANGAPTEQPLPAGPL